MEVSVGTAPPSHQHEVHNTERIAQAVAALLAPTIAASVEKAVQAGILHYKKKPGGTYLKA